MAIKDMMKSLIGKKESAVPAASPDKATGLLSSEDFPVYQAADVDLNRYQKFPLMELATLGAAFATLPESARTISKTVTTHIAMDRPVFAGIWPKGVHGAMIDKGLGFSGNITGIKPQGGTGIVGRMRFDLLENGVPATRTMNTVVPFDPMTMAVAAALICVNQKLDALQEKAEEILQFLKSEKRSVQRGNLNMLAEIMEEYKRDCNNEKMCAARFIEVQAIKREAHRDILFYQEQIAGKLKDQKAFPVAQKAQELLDAVMAEFYEYQLACYLYAYSSFMEMMLQKNYGAASSVAEKMEACAKKYAELYEQCRAQIASYQRSAIETQLLGGLGNAAKSVGQKIASVPILSKGPVDEALISAGESLGKLNRDAVAKKLEAFAPLEDSRMMVFIENTRRMDLLLNRPEAMLTDGENLYIMKAA